MANLTLAALVAAAVATFAHAQAPDRRPRDQTQADHIVRQLQEFPAALPAIARSDGRPDPREERRRRLHDQLRGLGDDAMPALARALVDPDVQLRRNAALFLLIAASSVLDPAQPKADIGACLPALITALGDRDPRVRHLAAQAIGAIGEDARTAVSALAILLTDPDEGSRNSACIGLAGIGPPAREALPALRGALSDPSAEVRRFAQRAIEKIEGPR